MSSTFHKPHLTPPGQRWAALMLGLGLLLGAGMVIGVFLGFRSGVDLRPATSSVTVASPTAEETRADLQHRLDRARRRADLHEASLYRFRDDPRWRDPSQHGALADAMRQSVHMMAHHREEAASLERELSGDR